MNFGFDLVDNEDATKPLTGYEDILVTKRKEFEEKYGVKLALCLHGGETR